MGSAVHAVSTALRQKLFELAKEHPVFHTANIHAAKPEDLLFENGTIVLAADRTKKVSYTDVLKHAGLTQLEVTEESKGSEELRKYASYSYSVHFVKVLVHPLTGVVRVVRVVTAVDAGRIISPKTAESQAIGGVVGGIGMALTEEGVIDHRFGRWVNKDFADYHVPVHADVPPVETLFVNKPDRSLTPWVQKVWAKLPLLVLHPL